LAHAFRMKEIAHQAGLSLATIDRVLHRRAHVPLRTIKQVDRAIAELEKASPSEGTFRAKQNRTIDVVMEAPIRFSALVQQALEDEIPFFQGAKLRCRYHLGELVLPDKMAALLLQIAKRGSAGVILKAADTPEIAAAIAGLTRKAIPVVTLVTDIRHSTRTAYVGIDNYAAGQTAAYLLGQWLGQQPAKILASLSSHQFYGEEERATGFRETLQTQFPHLQIVTLSGGLGQNPTTKSKALLALEDHRDIKAVYSIGGGNRALIQAFQQAERHCQAFIAHDLDADNRQLLAEGHLSCVLHHDLRQDVALCCRHIVTFTAEAPIAQPRALSPMQIITPYNVARSESH
jgi:LacI family transcriptional regulator